MSQALCSKHFSGKVEKVMKRKVQITSLLILILFLFVGCGKEQISGEQMVLAQIEFTESYFAIMDEVADTYSEYIAFNISEQRFKELVKEYLERIKAEEKRYADFNKKYELDPEILDQDVLNIVSFAEDARKCVKDILENTIDKGRILPRKELLELYMLNAEMIENIMNEFKEAIDNIS